MQCPGVQWPGQGADDGAQDGIFSQGQDRLEAPLKQMTNQAMTPIEGLGIDAIT